jgi:phosphate starvation-inducible protein PhoH
MKKQRIGVPTTINGKTVMIEFGTDKDITSLFRPSMIKIAATNDEVLSFDETTGRSKRLSKQGLEVEDAFKQPEPEMKKELDPVMQLIQNAHKIKPSTLEMSDIKWKYLVRSAVRGKNIMAVGPAGCGKTQMAKELVNVPVTEYLEVTEEEYQALLKDPNVIAVTKL